MEVKYFDNSATTRVKDESNKRGKKKSCFTYKL